MRVYLGLLAVTAATAACSLAYAQATKPVIPYQVTEDYCKGAYGSVQSAKAKVAATPQAAQTGNFGAINFAQRRDLQTTYQKSAKLDELDAYDARIDEAESRITSILRDGLKNDPAKVAAVLGFVRQCDALRGLNPTLGPVAAK